MFIFLLCRQSRAVEELLDIYQLLKAICQPKGFFMCSENHRHILLKARGFFSFYKLGRKTDHKQFYRSILKATWHHFAEDVVKFWQRITFIHRLYNKSIWKAWLMPPNSQFLFFIWKKNKSSCFHLLVPRSPLSCFCPDTVTWCWDFEAWNSRQK